MPLSVHLLCRRSPSKGGKQDRLGFKTVESGPYAGCIASHAWVIDKEDKTFSRVKALRRVYFHQAKASASEFGGIVRDVVESETEFDRHGRPRVIFIFEPDEKAEGVAWRGGNEQMRVVGRFVPASLPHEA